MACYGVGIVHPDAYLTVKRGPSGVLFVACALCRFRGFLTAGNGWEKAKFITRAEIVAFNPNALILP